MSDESPDDVFSRFKEPGLVPWEAIHGLARAICVDPGMLRVTLEEFDYLSDGPWEDMDCEFIYLCGALSLAGPELSPEQRAVVLGSLRQGMEKLQGSGDISEETLRSTLACYGEPGYSELQPVEQWVEQYSIAFTVWAKQMEQGWDSFAEGDEDEDFLDEEQPGDGDGNGWGADQR